MKLYGIYIAVLFAFMAPREIWAGGPPVCQNRACEVSSPIPKIVLHIESPCAPRKKCHSWGIFAPPPPPRGELIETRAVLPRSIESVQPDIQRRTEFVVRSREEMQAIRESKSRQESEVKDKDLFKTTDERIKALEDEIEGIQEDLDKVHKAIGRATKILEILKDKK